ncbi:hypothetical protein BH10ACI2_BH10ACI2_00050 [soil metagenome]
MSKWNGSRVSRVNSLVVFVIITALLLPSVAFSATRNGLSGSRIGMSAGSMFSKALFGEKKFSGTVDPVFLATTFLSVLPNPFLPQESPTERVVLGYQQITARLSTFSVSLLGLLTPTLKAKSEPVHEPTAPAPLPPASSVSFDFDGDGLADIGRWHATGKEFKVRKSTTGSYLTVSNLGTTTSRAAPGDFNGGGVTDAAVFSAGTWVIQITGGSSYTDTLGTTGDLPVVGDYDGDGKSDLAVYRPSTGYWYIKKSSDGATISASFGTTGDIPIPGDFDGDGKTDMAVYRRGDGHWYINESRDGFASIAFGLAIDIPVQGDFDGDGKSDAAVYRPSDGSWWIFRSSDAATVAGTWGNIGDQPVPADYDGDGKTDKAIWRPTTGEWYISGSNGTSGLQYYNLGVPGDMAVPSAYTRQVGGLITPDELAAARLKPKNATGGTNLYSQNFGWGTSVVSLPGRSGLDLNLGIGYNSLVWLKSGTTMYFDPDTSNVTPGFRFGFPTIEPVYLDSRSSKFTYMMVTPDGRRTEFRQVAASSTYDSVDSSYAQLVTSGSGSPNDPVEDLSLIVTGTDGTVMSYEWKSGAYRCTRITDRNGNFITNTYTNQLLTTVTDTLGRVLTVNYAGGQAEPSSITQQWGTDNGNGAPTTHTWATFSYTNKTVATSFDGSLSVVGPVNTTSFKVLDKITYADSSFTQFEYNGYLQVQKVTNYAADSSFLNYTSLNIASPGPNILDCPRFSETRTNAANFNLSSSGSPQDVIVTSTITPGQTYTFPDTNTGIGTRIDVAMTGHPNGNISRTYVGASGFREGLTIATEDCTSTGCTGTDRKRWTYTAWAQDDGSVSYLTNPRPTDTIVGDETNIKITHFDYRWDTTTGTYLYGLPETISTYAGGHSVPDKTQRIIYNLSSTYTSRHIIGLPAEVDLWEGSSSSGTLSSMLTYSYDEGSLGDSSLYQNISPVQHDTSFGASFVSGRGLVTSTKRCDVSTSTPGTSTPGTCSGPITTSAKYNTAGSPVAQISPWNGSSTRTTRIGYADVFNSSGNPATYAYPTTITDPAGSSLGDTTHSSTLTYRYDIGAKVGASSPAPGILIDGKTSKWKYDTKGRLERESIYVGAAEKSYRKFAYPNNSIESQSWSTPVDSNNNGVPDPGDEVYTESWFDGAGHQKQTRSPHSFNSDGTPATYVGSLTAYDKAGRVIQQTVPTEINSSWNPTGDDYRGMSGSNYIWLYNATEYDWKGRPVRTIPSDSNGSDGKDTLISYEGCGCAGGQITTEQGPLVPRDDQPTVNARRTQKTYADPLGRTGKTEVLNWNGSVYSTVKNTLNIRDRATLIRQYAGSELSSTSQDTVMTYDGYGRLKTSHKPEQSSGANTVYNYNLDDSISSVTDARNAVTSYVYNNNGLVDQISYSVPGGSGIQVPANVNLSYDNLGNRTAMTDGFGSVAYEYNQLSQMTAETRQFTDTMANAPLSSSRFKLTYTYGMAGQLASLTDPYGAVINYAYDRTGRLDNVTGTSFGGVTSYANNAKYRAWGGLKELTYGSTMQSAMTYNNALQPATYNLSGGNATSRMSKAYDYYADGIQRYAQDLVNPIFDRLQIYDHAGHLKDGKTGLEARGGSVTALADQKTTLPYRQSYQFNEFNNLTQRNNLHWGVDYWYGQSNNLSYTYLNNRITNSGFVYDADGRNLQTSAPDDGATSTYDAAGRMVHSVSPTTDATRSYDGDGREVKRITSNYVDLGTTASWVVQPTKYYIRSTVMGGATVSEAWANGKKGKTFVRAAGTEIARQSAYASETSSLNESVFFEYIDASGMSQKTTDKEGSPVAYGDGGDGSPVETDPLGSNAGTANPYYDIQVYNPDPDYQNLLLPYYDDAPQYVNGQRVTFTLDGMSVSFSQGISALKSGSANVDFNNTDSFLLAQLGIYAVRHEMGNTQAPPPPGSPSDAPLTSHSYATTQYSYEYFFSNISWSPAGQGINDTRSAEAVKNAIAKASGSLTGGCKDAIEKLLRNAFLATLKGNPETDYDKVSSDIRTSFDDFIKENLTATKLIDAVKGATLVYRPDDFNLNSGNMHASAVTSGLQGNVSVTFYAGFFNKIYSGKQDIVTNNNIQRPYLGEATSQQDRAFTIIHEGIHAIDRRFSDGFIGRIITGKDKNLSMEEGSKAINEFIEKNCK